MTPANDTLRSSASRRNFLRSASIAATATVFGDSLLAQASPQAPTQTQAAPIAPGVITAADKGRMRALAAFTALTFDTPNPTTYGADIVHTDTGERLMRATNAVGLEHDPSAHAETRTIRLACQSLKSTSLLGYTLYTTCEPCPMCMACALWAKLDRVVYGATISDAAKFGHQIMIPAAEVAKRTDMVCVVDGPVEHDACFALFTDPRMQKARANRPK